MPTKFSETGTAEPAEDTVIAGIPKGRQHNKCRRPHLKDEADDGCPGLPESRELEPVLLQHVVAAAQVEAEPALGREIHGARHPSFLHHKGTATGQGHGESPREGAERSG